MRVWRQQGQRMLIVESTTGEVRLVTSSAADIEVSAHGVDHTISGDVFLAWPQNTVIASATTTDIVASPGSGKVRNVKGIHIRNKHASTSNTVTVQHTANGSTVLELFKCILLAGEQLVLNEAGTWFHYDTNGGVYTGSTAASETVAGLVEIASVAEMEAGTDVTRAVTPGYQHRHPASPKAWLSCGVAADIQQSYNITSLTDTGTGVVTITIATDFAAANYAVIAQVEATGTTWAVANARETHVRSATRAAGSVAVDCIDNTTTTNLVKDPTTWHVVMFGDQ